MQLYMDAAASFWREWIINYDVRRQQTLGRDAATNTRQFFDDARRWVGRQHRKMLRAARRAHGHMTTFPLRWIGMLLGWVLGLTALINLRRLWRWIHDRTLRAHPERAPRESASLWYDRMVSRLARLGWSKAPSQTPADFVSAIREETLQQKVASFTRAYESARFGNSVEDAQSLPELFDELVSETDKG
jgi:hypothetical protein